MISRSVSTRKIHLSSKTTGSTTDRFPNSLDFTVLRRSPRNPSVARDCMLALRSGADVVIQHISSGYSVELVRTFKALGAKIHAEATPHHFTLNDTAVLRHGTLAKMNPPLRSEEDRLAIIRGLADGTLDLIATDHAPHSIEEKQKPLSEAPSGYHRSGNFTGARHYIPCPSGTSDFDAASRKNDDQSWRDFTGFLTERSKSTPLRIWLSLIRKNVGRLRNIVPNPATLRSPELHCTER